MTECPSCGANIRGKACKCGYVIKHGSPVINADQAAQRAEDMTQFQQECRHWLLDHHIVNDQMTIPQRQKATARFRSMVLRKLGKGENVGLNWANELKTRYIDGDILQPMQISMASEALDEVWLGRECTPRTTNQAAVTV